MNFVETNRSDGIAAVVLKRGKVNAINGEAIGELRSAFEELEADPEIKAVVFAGHGKFFSFGFDIPEFLSFAKEAFANFIFDFTDLYTYLFMYPKPVVAALNGHAIAGGCMLALACDIRAMAAGKAKISLNEIGFGSTVLAGSVEMLRFLVGNANAVEILYSGAMYSADQAKKLNLVQAVLREEDLFDYARDTAEELSSKSSSAFASIKSLLRKPVADEMLLREKESIREFLEIWYSPAVRENLKKIEIY